MSYTKSATVRSHLNNIQPQMAFKEDNRLRRWITTTCVRLGLTLIIVSLLSNLDHLRNNGNIQQHKSRVHLVSAHIVLTRDDMSQSLVITGEDGGKGKGKGGGGDQLVITGNRMGNGGQNSNMVMQDAANREGDVVMNGNSMIIPGEDGHIVLADSRSRQDGDNGNRPPPMQNLFAFWLPYMNSRMAYRMMPFFGGQFG